MRQARQVHEAGLNAAVFQCAKRAAEANKLALEHAALVAAQVATPGRLCAAARADGQPRVLIIPRRLLAVQLIMPGCATA